MEDDYGTMSKDKFLVLQAILLWHHTLEKMTYKKIDEKYNRLIARLHLGSDTTQYTYPDMEKEVDKVIHDFYDYFYTNQHIADFNYMNYDLFTNDYVHLANILANNNHIEIDMLWGVTNYTFEMVILFREELHLPVFERKKHDKYIVQYYKRYYGKNKSYDGLSEGF